MRVLSRACCSHRDWPQTLSPQRQGRRAPRTGELHAQAGATRPQRHVLAGALYLAAVSISKSSCCDRAQASISFRSPSSASTLTQPASGLPVTGQMLRRPAHISS